MKFPKVSIITCTYNGERTIESFLSSIFEQDYPLEKIELILADGGSKDKTIEIIDNFKKKYQKTIIFFKNIKQYGDGRGMGVDNASRKSTGELILFLDQDNILIQKYWLREMVKILTDNKEIVAVQSRMALPKEGTTLDKYLNSIGIEDPFTIPYSLNAQIIINPKRFIYDEKKKYYLYVINKKEFLYAGGNGFLIRKREFFENGGWSQDVDNFYRMADKNIKVAIPKDIKIYHKTSTNLIHFVRKRGFYVRHYLLENYQERDFYWFNLEKNNLKQNLKFLQIIIFNLLIFPGTIQGIKMTLRKMESFWMIHPFILFILTITYIYSFFYAKIFRKEKMAEI